MSDLNSERLTRRRRPAPQEVEPELLRVEWKDDCWWVTARAANGIGEVDLRGYYRNEPRIWEFAKEIAEKMVDYDIYRPRCSPASEFGSRAAEARRICDGWPVWNVAYILQNEAFPKVVKVGSASVLPSRLGQYILHCPMPWRLLAASSGGAQEEIRLQALFRASHYAGEWYRLTREVRAEIDRLAATNYATTDVNADRDLGGKRGGTTVKGNA